MTFSFSKPNDLTGLENAMAWGQGQGQLTADGNWSDVQRAAFAAIAASFGYTDANHDGTYEYDGKTKGPTGDAEHKLVGDALTEAANGVVVGSAATATKYTKSLKALDKVVDTLAANHASPGFSLPQVAPLIDGLFDSTEQEVRANAQETAQSDAALAAETRKAVEDAAQVANDDAAQLTEAGYDLTPEAHAAVTAAGTASEEVKGYASHISTTVKTVFFNGKDPASTSA